MGKVISLREVMEEEEEEEEEEERLCLRSKTHDEEEEESAFIFEAQPRVLLEIIQHSQVEIRRATVKTYGDSAGLFGGMCFIGLGTPTTSRAEPEGLSRT